MIEAIQEMNEQIDTFMRALHSAFAPAMREFSRAINAAYTTYIALLRDVLYHDLRTLKIPPKIARWLADVLPERFILRYAELSMRDKP